MKRNKAAQFHTTLKKNVRGASTDRKIAGINMFNEKVTTL